MSVRVPGVKPGVVARLPFAVAALCFLFSGLTIWGHPPEAASAGAWWFLGGAAAFGFGAAGIR